MKITHDLEGKYFLPNINNNSQNYIPILVAEISIESNGTVWIKGYTSIWFRLDECHVGSQEELATISCSSGVRTPIEASRYGYPK